MFIFPLVINSIYLRIRGTVFVKKSYVSGTLDFLPLVFSSQGPTWSPDSYPKLILNINQICHDCSETTPIGESKFHLSTPLGIELGSLMMGSKQVDHWSSAVRLQALNRAPPSSRLCLL